MRTLILGRWFFGLGIFIVITGGVLAGGRVVNHPLKSQPETGYWIWAGIKDSDVPDHTNSYLYQGLFTQVNGKPGFVKRGLYPYPIPGRRLHLVFRLESLNSKLIVHEAITRKIRQWESHGNLVVGIQLDFDSPTSKLLPYSNYLEEIRCRIPNQYQLSVTGLLDWLHYPDRIPLQQVGKSVDFIAFQFYQGKKPLSGYFKYLESLRNLNVDFKIGLLPNFPSNRIISSLKSTSRFKGTIYFFQKQKKGEIE